MADRAKIWHSAVMRFRIVAAIAALLLLVFGTVLAVIHQEPLALVAAVGLWLWIAREGYLLLFSIAGLAIVVGAPIWL